MRLLLLLTSYMVFGKALAQTTPPIPPIPPVFLYAIDYDLDGTAVFNIGYYLEEIVRPGKEGQFSVDLSGYDIQAFYSVGTFLSGDYQSLFQDQLIFTEFTYNGNGPELDNIGQIQAWSNLLLTALPFNGDYDSDGVPNELEDLNDNGNPMDENTDEDLSLWAFNFNDTDDDNDGIPTINEDYNANGDYFDDDLNSNGIPDFIDMGLLSSAQASDNFVVMFPNPAQGILHFKSNGNPVENVRIIDLSGKIILQKGNPGDSMEIYNVTPGIYLIQATFQNQTLTQKLIVR